MIEEYVEGRPIPSSSSALISGGQMNFIVTQAPMKKTTS